MDHLTLAQTLVTALKSQGLKVTTIESCTGGLIAGAITRISGSSEVFEYGFVTYANAAKTSLVGVPEYLLESHGAVSVEVAASMAEGGLKTADADIALSVTGIAGPTGGSTEKPVGMVCFGLSRKNAYGEPETYAQIKQFGNIGRDEVRAASVEFALEWALQTLDVGDIAAEGVR
jgi:nicotinamide-nucleotide amidase